MRAALEVQPQQQLLTESSAAVNRVRWDKVPGFAILHRQGLWWEAYVREPALNLPDSVQVPAAEAECQHVRPHLCC